MKTKPNMIAQGDVMLIPLIRVKGELVPRPNGPRGCVLAEGEATGHHHRIEDPGARLFEPKGTCHFYIEGNEELQLDSAGLGVTLLDLEQPGTLVHEEHGPHALAPGKYLVIRQRERSLLDWRPVID